MANAQFLTHTSHTSTKSSKLSKSSIINKQRKRRLLPWLEAKIDNGGLHHCATMLDQRQLVQKGLHNAYLRAPAVVAGWTTLTQCAACALVMPANRTQLVTSRVESSLSRTRSDSSQDFVI